MVIRPYRRDDLPFILEGSASNAWDLVPPGAQNADAWSRAWQASRSSTLGTLSQEHGTAFVVEDGRRPVAFILLAIGPDSYTGELFGYIADIFVAPEYRRLGLGRALHQEADRYFATYGIHRGKLWVSAANQKAIASAKVAGFEVEAYILSKQY